MDQLDEPGLAVLLIQMEELKRILQQNENTYKATLHDASPIVKRVLDASKLNATKILASPLNKRFKLVLLALKRFY